MSSRCHYYWIPSARRHVVAAGVEVAAEARAVDALGAAVLAERVELALA
jgi:hypothetical protein